MRRFVLPAITVFLAFSLTANAAVTPRLQNTSQKEAEDPSVLWENRDTGYFVILEDDADLLDEEEETQLSSKMQEITAYGNAAFKSVSYNDRSASYFADTYYHKLFGTQSGTLFLIDMDNREIYIFSDGANYKTITASYANTITDNVYRYASKGDYYSCAYKAFEQIGSLLSGRKIAQPMKYISNLLLALILAALINYFIVMTMSGTAKPSKKEILGAASTGFKFTDPYARKTHQTKTYSPQSSGSSGGGHSGGGGGGHSGGGGGHRF